MVPGMIDQYVNWLVSIYTTRFGHAPAGPDVIARGTAILRKHASRMRGEDEFVSLMASEAAERLNSLDVDTKESFLRILDKAADAARHRVLREARRWQANLPDPAQIPAPPDTDAAKIRQIKAELLEGLSLEEHLIIEQLLVGESVVELAQRLGVSRRTLYRRLAQIRQRIKGARKED
jgi:DNA-directed RNA polymerase specialized sigma24 family protein